MRCIKPPALFELRAPKPFEGWEIVCAKGALSRRFATRCAGAPYQALKRLAIFGRRFATEERERDEIGGMPWSRSTLLDGGAHSLAPRPGSLVRLAFQLSSKLGVESASLESAHGRSCTGTPRILSALPLLLGYVGESIADFKLQIADLNSRFGNGRRGENCTPKAA